MVTVQRSDYSVDIHGNENIYETGLGRICNDGSFPLALMRSKFANIINDRVNCKFVKRNGDVWIKSKLYIRENEELLICYADDLSYWKSMFSSEQLQRIKEALRSCPLC